MPKNALIAPQNVLYQARMRAKESKPLLANREAAAELAFIPRLRMIQLETGRRTPNVDEVTALINLYDDPGLMFRLLSSAGTKETPA